jgi:hypothetical protein
MVTTVREERREEFLSTLRKGQDIALDALKVLVETIQFVTPVRPADHVPLADRLPTPHEVVASTNDFAEKLLANQRVFADEVITVVSPLLPGKAGKEGRTAVADGEAKPAASRAAKPAAA